MSMLIAFPFALAFNAPPGGLRALGTRAPGLVLQASADSKDLAARVSERWKFLRDNPGADAAEAAGDLNPMQRSRDAKLAERDTRQWCVDRCLATGYCEAVEDLWELSSKQVLAFCEQCAQEDECELVYEKADEYMGHLATAAAEAAKADEALARLDNVRMARPRAAVMFCPVRSASEKIQEEANPEAGWEPGTASWPSPAWSTGQYPSVW
eukprot:CAMPEP_0119065224 /NCGR_PEP_ID=MMETSP1178-20130426/8090_1 /TAXON_ID=33656 /ORGANISM="unid sp, Strain CCMP2000" /LENGTH=210 /DNA_ID=CAMNT_0007046725 /DNA_START=42 /DNA_END=675 /DNA_ORIENTATION=+